MSQKSRDVDAGTAKLAGLQVDLLQKLRSGCITLVEFERFLHGERALAPRSGEAQLAEWKGFYRAEFGMECDFNILSVPIPAKRQGFDRLIVVAQGLTAQQVFDRCQHNFRCYNEYDNLLGEVVSCRVPQDDHYAIWVRNRVEADAEHAGRTAHYLENKRILGTTLLEQFLFQLKYFAETGEHLDMQGITLCSGSKYGCDHDIPGTHSGSGGVRMSLSLHSPDAADDRLCVREVVVAA